jgi:protocatechuate 3,4-dioxygenase beta subunit
MKRFLARTLWDFGMIAGTLLTFTSPAATNQYFGKVLDAKGAPVPDAAVDCYQYPTRGFSGAPDLELKQHATSDSKGSFSLPALDGNIVVLAKKAGLAAGWRYWNPLQGESDCNVVLPAAAALAGVVVDENRQPVRDAEVWVIAAVKTATEGRAQQDFLLGKPARELFSVRTAADGKFRIANFPAGAQAVLGATRTGKALRQTRSWSGSGNLPYHSGQEDIELVMEPGGIIEGKIAVKDTGQPLARVFLAVQPVAAGMNIAGAMPPIQSDANGTFRIPDLPAGAYRISANFQGAAAPEWVTEPVPVTVAAGQTVRDVTVQATKGGVVEVTIVSKGDQKSPAGMSINAYSEGFQASALVGSNGMASLRLPPGQFTVMAYKEGWAQMQSQTSVQAGQTNRVRIEVAAPFKITGIIRDSAGAPVPGARVSVLPNFGGNNSEVKTDNNGRYEATWQQPTYAGMGRQNFFLLARSVERNLAGTHNIDEGTTNLDLRLEPGITVSTRVQDANGKPIAGATVSLMVRSDDGGSSTGSQPPRTDEQGRVSFPAMPMGRHYGMWVNANGYGSTSIQDVASEPGKTTLEFPVFTLKTANRKLAGKVLGTDGKPAVGVQVHFNGEGQPNASAQTDAKGEFFFDGVCEGPLSVQANVQGAYGNVDAMGGDTNVVVRISANNRTFGNEKTVTITGKVLNPYGVAVAGVRVLVTPAFGLVREDAISDSKGQFSVDWSPQRVGPNSKYLLIARDPERNLAASEEITETSTSVDLKLQPGLTVSGSVQDADGAPLRGASVNLNLMSGSMGGMVDRRPILADDQGAFKIAGLPSGRQYSVHVSANGYGTMSRQVRPNESHTNLLEMPAFKLKKADRQLAGRVVGPDDKPIPGAQVQINGNGQPNGNTRADSSGNFTFKVCDGPITVFAFQNRSTPGPIIPGQVQARGGDTNVVVKVGVQGQRPRNAAQASVRATPLKPQPWTWNSLTGWPGRHKTAKTILLGLQIAVFVGTASGVFWFIRMRR